MSLPIWERGLKLLIKAVNLAPKKSLPIWERGLKPSGIWSWIRSAGSLPIWERGLKQNIVKLSACDNFVAPYMGAWIETLIFTIISRYPDVAPYMGAWIETDRPGRAGLSHARRSLYGSVD